MKLSLKADEHIQIQHDAKLAFQIYITNGVIHVRAKTPFEPKASINTAVIDDDIEIVK